jgi:aspartyl protease family protein
MNELPGWVKHVTVWLVLGVLITLGVQAWQARAKASRFVVQGSTVSIDRSDDGHYHWAGRVAGREVEFLVDTGATASAIPLALAQQLKLPVVGTVQSQTAGGPATGSVVIADLELQGGVRVERLRLTALPGLSSALLGMDVLGRLRWQQDAGRLRVETAGAAR